MTKLPSSDSRTAGAEPLDRFDQLGKYKLLRRLGEGGMGVVFLANDTQIGRQVALKITKFTAAEEPRLLKRLYQEARVIGNLRSPHLCIVHDVNQIDGTHYIDMEYVPGETYLEWIEREAPADERTVARQFSKIARAMELAHRSGVLHRDIKPANLMIRPNGEPVIMDFGLAREMDPERTRLTFSGELVGTVAYLPPEQVTGMGDELRPSSDIYSLGATMYQALTGRVPYEGSRFELLMKIMNEQPAPPHEHHPELDPVLSAIVMRTMARAPQERFQSMSELAAALEDFAGTADAPPAPTPADPALAPRDPSGAPPNWQAELDAVIRQVTQLRDQLATWPSVQGAVDNDEENRRRTELLRQLRAALEQQQQALGAWDVPCMDELRQDDGRT